MKPNLYRIAGGIAAAVVVPLAILAALGVLEVNHPLWLLTLAVVGYWPWVASRSLAGAPPRVQMASVAIRTTLGLGLTAALADLRYVKGDNSLSVLFVLDQSASIPDATLKTELAYVNAAAERLPAGDRAGLVVFGENASVEILPAHNLQVERLFAAVRRDYTNIQQALELASAAFPQTGRRKIVLMTDGNENAGSLAAAAQELAANDIALDILPLRLQDEPEMLVDALILPEEVRGGETFEVRARVLSRVATRAEIAFSRDGEVADRRSVELQAGANTIRFTTSVAGGGFHNLGVRIAGGDDTLAGNNEYTGAVFVRGPARLLLVAPQPAETAVLAAIATGAGLQVDQATPATMPTTPMQLYGYDCIVLANVPASAFSADTLTRIETGVRELGIGLIMTGGEDSFAAGGWDGTPIAQALPVSLDPNRKREMPKGALVLILHTCEFPDGNYWAKEISKAALHTLSAQDEAGLLFFDAEKNENWLFPITSLREEPTMRQLIDRCEPGDMLTFAPSFQMALDGLLKSDAAARHIIVISDGDPHAPVDSVVSAMADAKISVSTIAVNPHSPRDLEVMKKIAAKTQGRYYLVHDPRTLPAVFIREARRVQRGTIIRDPFRPRVAAAGVLTDALAGERPRLLFGRVAVSARDSGVVDLITEDGYDDPVLAHWQYGLGRVVAFASDAGAAWGREWATWDAGSRMWRTILEWTARPGRTDDLQLTTGVDGDRGILTIDAIGAGGHYRNSLTISGSVSALDRTEAIPVIRNGPGRYRADFPLHGVGVHMVNIAWRDTESGAQGVAAAAISVPYAPEYRAVSANLPLLHEAAATAAGRILAGDAGRDPIYAAQVRALRSPQLLYGLIALAAAILFFFDVALRRLVIRRSDLRDLVATLRAPRVIERDDAVARLRTAAAARPVLPPLALPATPSEPSPSTPDKDHESAPAPGPTTTASDDQAPPQPEDTADTGVGGYTSRLLAAKKRSGQQSPDP